MDSPPTTSFNDVFVQMYKYSAKSLHVSQNERREKFLQEQKEKRQSSMDKNRNLSNLLSSDEEEMECDVPETSRKRKNEKLKFKLMKSEWLTDVPEDLSENWLVKFCPDGFRNLLVAKKCSTKLYTMKGKFLCSFQSHLPGGGSSGGKMTVLDCVFHKNTNTYFINDCLCWNGMLMLESEAQLRFFWLRNKFEESPSLQESTTRQRYFKLVDFYPAEIPLVENKMCSLMRIGEHTIPYDGVVFYHKESHYSFGYTPLVCWSASFMLGELFQINVHPEHLTKKPKNYEDVHHYLTEICKKKIHKRRYKPWKSMEVVEES